MLTLGINISNQFSPKTVSEKYYYAYIFMGTMDAICLVLFFFIFKSRSYEEDIDREDESNLVQNLKY